MIGQRLGSVLRALCSGAPWPNLQAEEDAASEAPAFGGLGPVPIPRLRHLSFLRDGLLLPVVAPPWVCCCCCVYSFWWITTISRLYLSHGAASSFSCPRVPELWHRRRVLGQLWASGHSTHPPEQGPTLSPWFHTFSKRGGGDPSPKCRPMIKMLSPAN